MHGHLRVAIMVSIAKNKLNGYEIAKSIEDATGWKPSYGSLHPMLQKLKVEGYIKEEKKNNKNLYSLTFKGKKMLLQLKKNQDRFVNSVKKILKVMDSLTSEDFSGRITPLLENVCENYHRFAKLDPELKDFHSALFTKVKNGNLKHIKGVLREARKKLEK